MKKGRWDELSSIGTSYFGVYGGRCLCTGSSSQIRQRDSVLGNQDRAGGSSKRTEVGSEHKVNQGEFLSGSLLRNVLVEGSTKRRKESRSASVKVWGEDERWRVDLTAPES